MGSYEEPTSRTSKRYRKTIGQDLVVQRIAQGFRDYLAKTFNAVDINYKCETENNETKVVCDMVTKDPSRIVKFTLELKEI